MDNNELKKAFDLWSNFKQEVLYNNRFVIKHEVLDNLEQLVCKCEKQIGEEIVLYRGRLFSLDDSFLKYLESDFDVDGLDNIQALFMIQYQHDINRRKDSGFWGYDGKDSFVPPENDCINEGRTNPSFIKYLYTAEDPYTALVEVRPYLNSKVSIAEIRIKEPLRIVDFSYESFGKFEGFEQNLVYLIMSDFSIPSDSDLKKYIPTQYIAEFIKSLGFDGIKFNSSLHGRGRNITIFNYDKCYPIGSKLYEISDICFEAKGLAPKNEKDLIHWKLGAYKEKKMGEIFAKLMKKNNIL